MTFDKHGLLLLILYEDSCKEIVNSAVLCRKRIREMKREVLAARLVGWLPILTGIRYSIANLAEPGLLREMSDMLGRCKNQGC